MKKPAPLFDTVILTDTYENYIPRVLFLNANSPAIAALRSALNFLLMGMIWADFDLKQIQQARHTGRAQARRPWYKAKVQWQEIEEAASNR